MKKKIRCPYFELNDLERAYHDKEWGTPCRNDRKLFECLMYEVLQCGGAEGSDMIATVAGVYDILLSMRRCGIKLPNRCYHLISRVAHRAMTKDGRRRIERVAPL